MVSSVWSMSHDRATDEFDLFILEIFINSWSFSSRAALFRESFHSLLVTCLWKMSKSDRLLHSAFSLSRSVLRRPFEISGMRDTEYRMVNFQRAIPRKRLISASLLLHPIRIFIVAECRPPMFSRPFSRISQSSGMDPFCKPFLSYPILNCLWNS